MVLRKTFKHTYLYVVVHIFPTMSSSIVFFLFSIKEHLLFIRLDIPEPSSQDLDSRVTHVSGLSDE